MTRTALLVAALTLLASASAVAAPSASSVYGADCVEVSTLPSDAPSLYSVTPEARADRFCKASGSSVAVTWDGTPGSTHYSVKTYRWSGSSWQAADEYWTTGRSADLWFEGKARYYAVELMAWGSSPSEGKPGPMVVVEVEKPSMARPSERAAVEGLQHFVKRLQAENAALRAELREATGRESGGVASR